jgi:chorismate-pyruvate lyase
MSFASDVTAHSGFRRDAAPFRCPSPLSGVVEWVRLPVCLDSFITRLQIHALLRKLNAELLSHDSATLTLERWCEARGLASPAHVVAERQHSAHAEPSSELRRLLAVNATDQIRHRRVRLRCGCRVLSEADNWYVPGRLTEEMNRVLDTTDVAFGRAVRRLNFRRRTLSSMLLWSPLSPEWATDEAPTAGHGRLDIPAHVLQHRAFLTLPDGTPFSHLVETYTREIVAFAEPQSQASAAAGASDELIFATSSRMAGEISRSAGGRTLASVPTPLLLPR